MKKRVAIWCGLGLVALAGAGALVIYFQPQPRIDRETLDRITPGMTEREVERLIGAPAGKYCDFQPTDTRVQQVKGDYKKEWVGNDLIICVGFSEGYVVGKGLGYVTGSVPKASWWERMTSWLGF